MLIERLPPAALLRQTPEQLEHELEPEWTVEMELMARLIEVVSITASGRQLKDPIKIPRPGDKKAQQTTPAQAAVAGGPVPDNVVPITGHQKAINVLRNTAKGVHGGGRR